MPRGGRRPADRPGRYPSLLVAEDYEGARVPTVRYLNRFGFRVEEAANGDEALARIHAASPHVILTALRLPAMPAQRLARWLAQSGRQIPMIVMTGDAETAVSDRLPQRPAGILLKPYTLPAMLDEVRRVLRTHPTLGR